MRTLAGVLLIVVLGAPPLSGALGEQESSVSADRQFLRGQIRKEVHQGYRLHQITDANGAVVCEYVSPAGKVFGVSWQGPYVPNMQQLLGSYFTYLQQYAQAQTGRHGGPLMIQRDNFVFTNSGHLRWSRGRAYVPSLLPTNLSPEVVQ
jgi:hypothetical protein